MYSSTVTNCFVTVLLPLVGLAGLRDGRKSQIKLLGQPHGLVTADWSYLRLTSDRWGLARGVAQSAEIHAQAMTTASPNTTFTLRLVLPDAIPFGEETAREDEAGGDQAWKANAPGDEMTEFHAN
jgi:hypothetical protein